MSEATLLKIHNYASQIVATHQSYFTFQRRTWSTESTRLAVNDLSQQLGVLLDEVTLVERTNTLPTLRQLNKDISSLTSSKSVPSQSELLHIVSQLERHVRPLNRVVKAHTSTLSKMKRLELTSAKAKVELLSHAYKLKKQGKETKVTGFALAASGVLLAPITLGLSLLMVAPAGGILIDEGNQLLDKYRTAKAETTRAFASFSTPLTSSIDIVGLLAGWLVSLSGDIRSLSTSKTPIQLRKARSKAVHISRAVSKYISLTELWHEGNSEFFPYERTSNIMCDGCKREITPSLSFYHCQTCTTVDFCVECYRSCRHQGHDWTKHSKAQFLTHGYQICHRCLTVINAGEAGFCGSCVYQLCSTCIHSNQHEHTMYILDVRWYDIFDPKSGIGCDECCCTGKECGVMYQCVNCYWYFVCEDCRENGGFGHPHQLLCFRTAARRELK